MSERVPVKRLQAEVKDSGITLSNIAKRLGWVVFRDDCVNAIADTNRVKRTLGLLPMGNRKYQRVVNASTAQRIRALL